MALVLPLGTLLGYTLGHRLASALLGEATPSFAEQDPGTLAAILLLSMIPGVAATWFFLSRANLEASRLRRPSGWPPSSGSTCSRRSSSRTCSSTRSPTCAR